MYCPEHCKIIDKGFVSIIIVASQRHDTRACMVIASKMKTLAHTRLSRQGAMYVLRHYFLASHPPVIVLQQDSELPKFLNNVGILSNPDSWRRVVALLAPEGLWDRLG